MPKVAPKLRIRLDLLRPQSSPEKLPVKLLRWLLSTGRYIFILVEGLVLLAFIFRFKLDADLAERKESIEQQIPYIESLGADEILIRQTQLKLKSIDAFALSSADYPQILKRIADQTPQGVKILSLNLKKEVGKVTIQINAQAQNNSDVTSFVLGMKEGKYFSDVVLASIGLEQDIIRFTVNAKAEILAKIGESL